MVNKTLNYAGIMSHLAFVNLPLGEQIGYLSPMSTDHTRLWIYYTVVILSEVGRLFGNLKFRIFICVHFR